MAMASVHAQTSIPAGSTVDLGGGSSDLGCTDLLVEGTFIIGAGGAVTGVRNVVIATTGSLNLGGGTIQLSQQWTAQGPWARPGPSVQRVRRDPSAP